MRGTYILGSALVAFLLASMAVSTANAAVLAANKTEMLFDGEKIHGLKGFTYKVYKDRQDVRGIGMNERTGVVYGRLHVKGKILVHSNSELLNSYIDGNTSFQIVLSVMQDSYPEGLGIKYKPTNMMIFHNGRITGSLHSTDGDIAIYEFTADSPAGSIRVDGLSLNAGDLVNAEFDSHGYALTSYRLSIPTDSPATLSSETLTLEESANQMLLECGYRDISTYTFTSDRLREA